MKNKLTSLIIGTALIGTLAVGTEASAAQIEIQQGDTLWNIAQTNNMTVDELKEVNSLTSNIILPKQVLETSSKSNKDESTKDESNKDKKVESNYTVKSGDTLSGIGLDYGVKVNELKDWNDLDSDLITINQKLLIKGIEEKSTEAVEEKAEEKAEKPVEQSEPEEKPAVKEEPQVEQAEPKEEPAEKKATQEKQSEPAEEKAEKQTEEPTENKSGQSMTMEATAYTAECNGCTGVTATGIDLNSDRNKKVIAVDPSVIPLGSRVHVEGYGEAIAGDTGGDIKGSRIDLHMPTKDAAYSFGRKSVNITVLD